MIDKLNRRIQLIASVNCIPILHQIAFRSIWQPFHKRDSSWNYCK